MGQKINPTGFRLSVTKNWTSKWYANNTDFAKMLKVLAGFSGLTVTGFGEKLFE